MNSWYAALGLEELLATAADTNRCGFRFWVQSQIPGRHRDVTEAVSTETAPDETNTSPDAMYVDLSVTGAKHSQSKP